MQEEEPAIEKPTAERRCRRSTAEQPASEHGTNKAQGARRKAQGAGRKAQGARRKARGARRKALGARRKAQIEDLEIKADWWAASLLHLWQAMGLR